MIFKLLTHAVVFAAGAGAGVYWGVHNPTQAANFSDLEQVRINQAVAAAKQQVLQKVVADQSAENATGGSQPVSHLNEYQEMLNTSQKDLAAAKAKLNGQ